MNFTNDLAVILKDDLRNRGFEIDDDWDDHDIIVKYLDFSDRCFFICRPRAVVYSRELQNKLQQQQRKLQQQQLTDAERSAISSDISAVSDIRRRIETGEDLEVYSSRIIRDISTEKSDFMLKNWNICHLHLERKDRTPKYTKQNLLFLRPYQDVVYFIDVRRHLKGEEWFCRELLEIIFDNWPHLLHYCPGIEPSEIVQDNSIFDLTKQLVLPIQFREGSLFPFGVNGVGNSVKSSCKALRIWNRLKTEELKINSQKEMLKKTIEEQFGIMINEPLDFELILEDGVLFAREKHSSERKELFSLYEYCF